MDDVLAGKRVRQYSGGWQLTAHVERTAPAGPQQRQALDPGPLEDLRAMSARYERSSKTVREAARGVYDAYLRANRVPAGIGSYDAVARLRVGTRFKAPGTPALR